jgi:hypothetical protein
MSSTQAIKTLLVEINRIRRSERFRTLPKSQQRELLAYAAGLLDAMKMGGVA